MRDSPKYKGKAMAGLRELPYSALPRCHPNAVIAMLQRAPVVAG